MSASIFHQLSTVNYQLPIAVVTNYEVGHAHGRMPQVERVKPRYAL